MVTILGINAFHGDAAACLVRDGHLVAAAEEERFRRIKHWAGFPSEAIRYCLDQGGIALDAVDHVALNQDSKANLGKKLAYALAKRPDLGMVLDRIRNKRERAGVETHLERAFPGPAFRGRVHPVEHHVAHLSSAFHVSPFDEAVVVSVDGFGDFASAAWGVGRGTQIDVEDRVYFPHSLGIFYQALTQFIGFPQYGDEYKVMGLAPYGEPRFLDAMRSIVLLQGDGSFRLEPRLLPAPPGEDRLRMGRRVADRGCAMGAGARSACSGLRGRKTSHWDSATRTSPDPCRRCTKRRSSICSRRSTRGTGSTGSRSPGAAA